LAVVDPSPCATFTGVNAAERAAVTGVAATTSVGSAAVVAGAGFGAGFGFA
jgi:hypothetical protein